MSQIAGYLIKTVIYSGIFTAYYWFFLRNKKFNQYNRYYLLTVMVMSLVIPLINLNLYTIGASTEINGKHFFINTGGRYQGASGGSLHWDFIAFAGSIVGSLFLLTVLLGKVVWIYKIKKRNRSMMIGHVCLIETELQQAPFSFLDNIFWKRSISIDTPEGQIIFRHEMAHIHGKHTHDKLFSQMLVSVCWMNPFFWIMQKELNLIHEFIADDAAIQRGDTAMFAGMLLYSRMEGMNMYPAQAFFHSPIKRRLMMIRNNAQHTAFAKLRKVLILPLAVLAILVLSFSSAQSQHERSQESDSSKLRKEEIERRARIMDSYHPQGEQINQKTAKEIVESIIQNPLPDRIYFIDSSEVSPEKITKLKYDKIKDVIMLPPGESMEKYGQSGKKGTIAFFLKP